MSPPSPRVAADTAEAAVTAEVVDTEAAADMSVGAVGSEAVGVRSEVAAGA